MPLTPYCTSVPLCYVYPAMLHYKACASTRRQKIADLALMVFGLIAASYTTIQTVKVRRHIFGVLSGADPSFQLMIEPTPAVPPRLGSCDIPNGLFHGGN